MNEMKIGTPAPWYERKWWVRVREIESIWTPQGWTGCAEFYVPFWAWPLELGHRMIFGNPKVGLAG